MVGIKQFISRAGSDFTRGVRTVLAVIWRALIKYDETDGEQRAASFAYYAFFAMFPLILLLITIATTFLGSQEVAAKTIISHVSKYIALESEDAKQVINTINGVVQSRKSAGIIAFAVLAWSAMRFFQALVRGVNRAWGTKEYSWWRLPIKNLFMLAILGSALLLGIIAPTILKQIEAFYWTHSWEIGLDFGFFLYVFKVGQLTIPFLVLFYGMSIFYKFAPRRRTTFREVWYAALFVTFSLELLQRLFVLYTKNVGQFNALYGTFGSVVALLLWIYLSGSIIILGGCLSAAQYEIAMHLADQSESSTAE